MRQLTILGEAANNISKEFRQEHPEFPWHQMIILRNRLMHEYSNIDHDIVWDTIQNDLPLLKKQLASLQSN